MKILFGNVLEHRDDILNLVHCQKPYFHPDFAAIMSRMEMGGDPEFYLVCDKSSFVYYQYVRRDIASTISQIPTEKYYDIITPYDYGGYFYNDKSLLDFFFEEFQMYCKETHIISEFIRFLPVFSFDYSKFMKYMNLFFLREHIFVDISSDDFGKEFSASKKDNLRKARKNNLDVVRSNNIETFSTVYRKTMEKRNAHGYFRFDDIMFSELVKSGFGEIWDVFKDELLIASSLILRGDEDIYYFLAATDPEYLSCGASTFLIQEIGLFYRKKVKSFFLGGGKEGVYKFKEGFSKKRIPYYIGQNVYDEKIYKYLISISKRENNDFFPRYRERLI